MLLNVQFLASERVKVAPTGLVEENEILTPLLVES